MMSGMEPAIAGLVGAGVALLCCIFAYVLVRGRDDWRRREAQRTADKASRELSDALHVLQSGALLVGPHDEILVVNQQGEALGLARGNRVGFANLLHKVREVRVLQQPYKGPVMREMRPGDERLELATSIAPMLDDNVLVIADDESTQKRVEAVRRDFVANISHELKTPIGAVSVLAEAIGAAKDDPAAVARFVDKMQLETTRLAELVNQIIELSRLQSEDPLLTREVIDVTEVVREAISRSQERAHRRGVSLILARTTEARVMGDRWQLADAVTNLVQNAINYSDERARVTLSVVATGADGDQFVEIKVSDNGIGIKPEDQERIFERFYRVDYGRSRRSGGTGLGLSIVRHIALAHGGSVRVWSRPGQGSTFTLQLPAYLGTHAASDIDIEEND